MLFLWIKASPGAPAQYASAEPARGTHTHTGTLGMTHTHTHTHTPGSRSAAVHYTSGLYLPCPGRLLKQVEKHRNKSHIIVFLAPFPVFTAVRRNDDSFPK